MSGHDHENPNPNPNPKRSSRSSFLGKMFSPRSPPVPNEKTQTEEIKAAPSTRGRSEKDVSNWKIKGLSPFRYLKSTGSSISESDSGPSTPDPPDPSHVSLAVVASTKTLVPHPKTLSQADNDKTSQGTTRPNTPSSIWEKTLQRTKHVLLAKNLDLSGLNEFELQSTVAEDNLRVVINTLHKTQDQMQNSQLSYSDHNGNRVLVMEKLGSLLKSANKYASIVDIAIQHSPEITALVWAGVRTVMQVALNHVEAMECFETTMITIADKLAKCEFYASIYSEGLKTPMQFLSAANSKQLQESLEFALPDLYASVIVFSIKARQYFDPSAGRLQKFTNLWKPFCLEVQPFIDDILEKENIVKQYVDMSSMERIAEGSKVLAQIVDLLKVMGTEMKFLIHLNDIRNETAENFRNTKEILRLQIKNEDQELFELLSPLEPLKRHIDIRSLRLDQTGTWLLELKQFSNWRDSANEDNRVLSCYGMPGAGKSILCSLVIDSLESYFRGQLKIGIACLYSDFQDQSQQDQSQQDQSQQDQSQQDQSQQDLVNILGALLHRLITSTTVPRAQTQVIQRLDEIRNRKSKIELKELLELISKTAQELDCTIFCIDALDELEPHTRKQLLETLGEKLKGIRLFLTSRPHVQREVRHWLHTTEGHEIDISANPIDLRLYLRRKISDDASFNPDEMNNTLEEDITEKIVQQSQGMFLLPVLHIDLILEKPTIYERRKALESLPPDLQGTYVEAITRIQNSRKHASLGLRVLMWLHFAIRHLRVDELQHALAVSPGDTELNLDKIPSKNSIIESCFGLVVIEDETSTIRFVHFSLEEFFVEHADEYFTDSCNPVAEICLTYLNFTALRITCTGIGGLFHIATKFPFVYYASIYWGRHLAAGKCTDGITLLAFKYLRYKIDQPPCTVQHLYMSLMRQHELFAPSGQQMKNFEISPLHVAANFGLVDIMMTLLCIRDDLNVNSEASRGVTPLLLAVIGGHHDFIRALFYQCNELNTNRKAGKNGRTPLMWAVIRRHTEVVRVLVERDDVILDAADKFGRTPLSCAVQSEYLDAVRLLLGRYDVDAEAEDHAGVTPLSYAAQYGYLDIVHLLVERDDVDADSRGALGRTPLSNAVQEGHIEIARLLVARDDVDADASDTYGITPLMFAAAMGHLDIVYLLAQREDVNVDSKDHGGQTALSYAAIGGRPEIVRLLLEAKGVDADTQDYSGRTPLSLAAAKGRLDIVAMLLERNDVDADAKDYSGRTPLSHSAETGRLEVVQLLVERDDVDINSRDNCGRTPLAWACSASNQRQGDNVVLELLANMGGILIDERDNEGRTPLSFACYSQPSTQCRMSNVQFWDRQSEVANTWSVKFLLARPDVNANSQDHQGRTPLSWAVTEVNCENTEISWAVTKSNCENVELLLERGDVVADLKDASGRTPLSWAATEGSLKVVELLLERSDVVADSTDENGRTPLSWAVMAGRWEIVQLLLGGKYKVDPNLADKTGQTPLLLALANNRFKCMQLLAERDDLQIPDEQEAQISEMLFISVLMGLEDNFEWPNDNVFSFDDIHLFSSSAATSPSGLSQLDGYIYVRPVKTTRRI